MNQPAPHPNQLRLDAIRNRISLASSTWGVMAAENFCLVVGENTLEPEIVATFTDGSSYDDRELICHAPDDLRWLLERYTELATRYRRLFEQDQRSRPKPKNYAAECGIKCADKPFLDFLFTCHNVDVSDKERVAARIRTMLQITSRADLNTDEAAASRWRKLVADFENWRKK